MKPRDLGREDTSAERRDSVVASSFVVESGNGASVGLDDQSVGQEALDDAIQVARLECHEPVRPFSNRLYEAIAMPLLFREAEEELKVDRFEWQEAAGWSRHGGGRV